MLLVMCRFVDRIDVGGFVFGVEDVVKLVVGFVVGVVGVVVVGDVLVLVVFGFGLLILFLENILFSFYISYWVKG